MAKSSEQWASKTEFFLSCLGYCIGIGNVWRFPYLCYRSGGGAFLIPYLLMLFLVGIPLYFMETALGQFSSCSCLSIFKLSPAFKGAGLAILVVNFFSLIYYNVLISYPLLMIVKSVQGAVIPWSSCNNTWNTERCIELNWPNASDIFRANENLTTSEKYRTAADEFFNNDVLNISSTVSEFGSIVIPLVIVNILSWIFVFLCIMRGVKSVGKVVYFTATFPYLVLFVLFFRGITLPGAWEGIKFYLFPKWSQLTDLKTWADSAVQIFFALGMGWGGMINLASFNPFHDSRLKRDSFILPVINVATSIFAGFVVFSVLGFISNRTGLPVATVAVGGPGLAFVTYPEAIGMLPWPHLWAILFFFMLYMLGIDTLFVQIEAIVSSLVEEFPQWQNKRHFVALGTCFTLGVGSFLFVFQNGMYLIQLLDWYAAPVTVISICLVEIFMVMRCYGVENFIRDVEFMVGGRLSRWWRLCWRFITPIILLFILSTVILYNTNVTYNGIAYPPWAIALGWLISMTSLMCIPGYGLYKFFSIRGSFIKKMALSFTPQDWGPKDPEIRKKWEECCKSADV